MTSLMLLSSVKMEKYMRLRRRCWPPSPLCRARGARGGRMRQASGVRGTHYFIGEEVWEVFLLFCWVLTIIQIQEALLAPPVQPPQVPLKRGDQKSRFFWNTLSEFAHIREGVLTKSIRQRTDDSGFSLLSPGYVARRQVPHSLRQIVAVSLAVGIYMVWNIFKVSNQSWSFCSTPCR